MIRQNASSSARTIPISTRSGMQPGIGRFWRFPARDRTDHWFVAAVMVKVKDVVPRKSHFLKRTGSSIPVVLFLSSVRVLAQTTTGEMPPTEQAPTFADQPRWQDV